MTMTLSFEREPSPNKKKILKQVFNKTVLPLFQRRERRTPVLYTGEQELKDECIISLLSFQCS